MCSECYTFVKVKAEHHDRFISMIENKRSMMSRQGENREKYSRIKTKQFIINIFLISDKNFLRTRFRPHFLSCNIYNIILTKIMQYFSKKLKLSCEEFFFICPKFFQLHHLTEIKIFIWPKFLSDKKGT